MSVPEALANAVKAKKVLEDTRTSVKRWSLPYTLGQTKQEVAGKIAAFDEKYSVVQDLNKCMLDLKAAEAVAQKQDSRKRQRKTRYAL